MLESKPLTSPEDYTDPACPFCTEQYKKVQVRSIPADRVLRRLDEYLSENDTKAAERHLLYWLEEAILGHDERGEFLIRNELMGLYRKGGDAVNAQKNADIVLSLIDSLGIGSTAGAGTALINIATVKKAFGQADKALPLYEKARDLLESILPPSDERIGGLYNNMGLALTDLGRYNEAEDAYRHALAIMKNVRHAEGECAITWLNLAECAEKRAGLENAQEEIEQDLEKARALLDTPDLPQDGNHAFICEKCASSFGYYGYFAYESELRERSRRIYEGA